MNYFVSFRFVAFGFVFFVFLLQFFIFVGKIPRPQCLHVRQLNANAIVLGWKGIDSIPRNEMLEYVITESNMHKKQAPLRFDSNCDCARLIDLVEETQYKFTMYAQNPVTGNKSDKSDSLAVKTPQRTIDTSEYCPGKISTKHASVECLKSMENARETTIKLFWKLPNNCVGKIYYLIANKDNDFGMYQKLPITLTVPNVLFTDKKLLLMVCAFVCSFVCLFGCLYDILIAFVCVWCVFFFGE